MAVMSSGNASLKDLMSKPLAASHIYCIINKYFASATLISRPATVTIVSDVVLYIAAVIGLLSDSHGIPGLSYLANSEQSMKI